MTLPRNLQFSKAGFYISFMFAAKDNNSEFSRYTQQYTHCVIHSTHIYYKIPSFILLVTYNCSIIFYFDFKIETHNVKVPIIFLIYL